MPSGGQNRGYGQRRRPNSEHASHARNSKPNTHKSANNTNYRSTPRHKSSTSKARNSQSREVQQSTASSTKFLVIFLAFLIAIIFIVMAFKNIGPFKEQPLESEEETEIFGQTNCGFLGNRLTETLGSLNTFLNPTETYDNASQTYTLTKDNIASLSGQSRPYYFDLSINAESDAYSENESSTLSDEAILKLESASAYYVDNDISLGYFIVDVQSGHGIASNIDETIYGASSIKGPFCTFLCENLLPESIDEVSSSRKSLIEKTILYSDNDSYEELRSIYTGLGFDKWLSDCGVRQRISSDTYFPEYSTRESALMWLNIYNYITNENTTTSQWLSDTLSKTEVSFIRNGVCGESDVAGAADAKEILIEVNSAQSDTDEPLSESEMVSYVLEKEIEEFDIDNEGLNLPITFNENIEVKNKAGWIAGVDDNAICDSGIISICDHDYLITIMSSSRDTLSSEAACANLAHTLTEIATNL